MSNNCIYIYIPTKSHPLGQRRDKLIQKSLQFRSRIIQFRWIVQHVACLMYLGHDIHMKLYHGRRGGCKCCPMWLRTTTTASKLSSKFSILAFGIVQFRLFLRGGHGTGKCRGHQGGTESYRAVCVGSGGNVTIVVIIVGGFRRRRRAGCCFFFHGRIGVIIIVVIRLAVAFIIVRVNIVSQRLEHNVTRMLGRSLGRFAGKIVLVIIIGTGFEIHDGRISHDDTSCGLQWHEMLHSKLFRNGVHGSISRVYSFLPCPLFMTSFTATNFLKFEFVGLRGRQHGGAKNQIICSSSTAKNSDVLIFTVCV